jgi:hypothetical protein
LHDSAQSYFFRRTTTTQFSERRAGIETIVLNEYSGSAVNQFANVLTHLARDFRKSTFDMSRESVLIGDISFP